MMERRQQTNIEKKTKSPKKGQREKKRRQTILF